MQGKWITSKGCASGPWQYLSVCCVSFQRMQPSMHEQQGHPPWAALPDHSSSGMPVSRCLLEQLLDRSSFYLHATLYAVRLKRQGPKALCISCPCVISKPQIHT